MTWCSCSEAARLRSKPHVGQQGLGVALGQMTAPEGRCHCSGGPGGEPITDGTVPVCQVQAAPTCGSASLLVVTPETFSASTEDILCSEGPACDVLSLPQTGCMPGAPFPKPVCFLQVGRKGCASVRCRRGERAPRMDTTRPGLSDRLVGGPRGRPRRGFWRPAVRGVAPPALLRALYFGDKWRQLCYLWVPCVVAMNV